MVERDKPRHKDTKRSIVDFEVVLLSPYFKLITVFIRRKYGIPKNGFKTQADYNKWEIEKTGKADFNSPENIGSPSEYSHFLEDIEDVVKTLNLAPHSSKAVNLYITRNMLVDHYYLRSGRTPYTPKIIFDGQRLFLEIYANTITADVEAVWKEVIPLQEKLDKNKYRQSQSLSKQIAVFQLYIANGKSLKKTMDAIDKDNTFYEKYGDIPSENEIKQIVTRFIHKHKYLSKQ